MEELKVIDLVERLRARLVRDVPSITASIHALQTRNHLEITFEQLKEVLVATVLGLEHELPDGRREARRQLQLIESGQPLDSLNGRQRLFEQLRAAISVLNERAGSEDSFHSRLVNCPNLFSAAALVQKEFNFLSGRKVYEFLLAIGYPAAMPSADTMRFLFRLGQLPTPELTPQTRREYLEKMTHLARVSNIALPELDYLFGVYSGTRRIKGYRTPCGIQPRCAECTLTSFCAYIKHNPPKPMVQTVPIKEWAHEERPRERMLAGERLSSAELLAIILRSGTGTRSALDLGRELINKFGTLHALETASISQITEVPGIGPAKAIEIKAAIELGRRVVQPAADVRDGLKSLGSSRDVFDMYRARYKSATQEEFLLLVLNTKNKIQREVSVSRGTLNASIVHPRDVFKPALAEAAAGVVFVHNHPSGDPGPSPEDHALTRRLVEAGNILGIKVIDHVIIGAQTFYSFADNGLLG
jgi:DNA repair protein RadC